MSAMSPEPQHANGKAVITLLPFRLPALPVTGELRPVPASRPATAPAPGWRDRRHALREARRSRRYGRRDQKAADRRARRDFRQARRRDRSALLPLIVLLGTALAPVFFADMFKTVTATVGPSFGWLAWTVPAATEGCFAFLYLLDLYLLRKRKPMGWLRNAPYPFAVASLALNVWGSLGDIPGMVGHAAVTAAFFVPIIAAEHAARSLSADDAAVAVATETAAARQYAADIVRDQAGPLWRVSRKVPSLLRTRIRHARFPADVASAIRSAATGGDAAAWEKAVEKMVTESLTQRARMSAAVDHQVRQIRRQADADDVAPPERQEPATPARKPVRRVAPGKPATPRDKAATVLERRPRISARELAAECGVTKRTAERWKKDMQKAGGTP
jgi:hypothetical protein